MALEPHAENRTDQNHTGKGKGASVRKERQWEPRHGHKPYGHSDIHKNMEKEYGRGPHGNQGNEGVREKLTGRGGAPKEQEIKKY